MKLRKILAIALISFISICPNAFSQEEAAPASIDEIKGKVDGIDENVTTLLNDVAGLKKMKISGYLQIQFDKTEAAKGFGSMSPYDSSDYSVSRFRVRRSRLKFNYNAGLTQVVVQGDFSNEKFELKDAYLTITDPWTKYFTLTTGVFNRPNYEVEYSSSQRESMERSLVVRTLYPGERDLGAMITVVPEDWFKLQLATFNNTYQGDLKQFYPNHRNEPLYYMARITKELEFRDLGIGLDLGAHARFGNAISNSKAVFESDKNTTGTPDSSSMMRGDAVGRNWFGFEAQMYFDLMGGMKILGEYIMGNNVDEMTVAASKAAPIRKRDFNGFYVMLVKNFLTDFQFAAKYDSYNPNTAIAAGDITSTKDLAVSTIGIGLHSYSFSNVRISLWYEMPKTTTSENLVKGAKLLAVDPQDNLLTVRLQYKF